MSADTPITLGTGRLEFTGLPPIASLVHHWHAQRIAAIQAATTCTMQRGVLSAEWAPPTPGNTPDLLIQATIITLGGPGGGGESSSRPIGLSGRDGIEMPFTWESLENLDTAVFKRDSGPSYQVLHGA